VFNLARDVYKALEMPWYYLGCPQHSGDMAVAGAPHHPGEGTQDTPRHLRQH